MIDFLLKKHYVKLDILLELSNQKKMTISSFLSTLNIARTTLKRTLDDLNNDLARFSLPCTLEQNEQKKYYLVFSEQTSALAIHQRLKLFYLKESLHFGLLSLLLTSPSYSIHKLSEKLIVSTSYSYRLIKELDAQLNKFKLSISITDKGQKIEIIGHEPTIRIFSFIILSESYQSMEWPFHHITKEEIALSIGYLFSKELEPLAPSKQTQIYFYIAIFDQRIRNKKRLPRVASDVKAVISILKKNVDLTVYGKSFFPRYNLSQDEFIHESLFLNAAFRILISNSFVLEQKQAAGSKLLHSNLPFLTDITLLSKQLSSEFAISQDKHSEEEIVYYLTIYKLFLHSINIDLETLLLASYRYPIPSINAVSDLSDQINYFYEQFIIVNQTVISPLLAKRNFKYTCIVLNTLVKSYTQASLNIYVQFSKNFLGERVLEKKINHFFNSATLKLTRDFHQADLIISDSLDTENELKNKKYFYFYDLVDKNQWFELMLFIQICLLENDDRSFIGMWREYFN